MFVWSIIHAKYITEENDLVVVSSDSEKYLKIAKNWGAIPIKRPARLASDKAFTEPVMTHALSKVDVHLEDNVILLQPTSPLRSKNLMNQLKSKLETSTSAVSLTENYEFNWIYFDDINVKPTYKERPRRQDMQPKLTENGSIYFNKYKYYKNNQNRVYKKAEPLILNMYESIEIDNLEELNLIKLLSKSFNKEWLKEILSEKNLKNVFLDIDGVFAKNVKSTDSNKRFYSTLDSNTLHNLIKNGTNVVLISSEKYAHSKKLFEKIGIDETHFGVKKKLEFLKQYMKYKGIKNDECIFFGNDWQDRECLKYFNLSVVPIDANEAVKQYAKFVIDMPGGDGAITEFFNLIY